MALPQLIIVPPIFEFAKRAERPDNKPHELAFTGPRWQVQIHPLEEDPKAKAPATSQQGLALVDSGAIATAIDKQVADHFQLRPADEHPFSTPFNDQVRSPLYPFTIRYKGYIFNILKAPVADLQRHGLIALIGRDILLSGLFEHNGRKGTWEYTIPELTPLKDQNGADQQHCEPR